MEKVVTSVPPVLSLSVVSHGQMGLITHLMQDIEVHCKGFELELILTLNISENVSLDLSQYSYRITVIQNKEPMGFGANHNQACQSADGEFFCILNPDIRLSNNPFLVLMAVLRDQSIGVVAPMVLNPQGTVEDSARRFPTVQKIARKLIGQEWTSDYVLRDKPVDVDWVAGMFMVFPRAVFEQLKGFNERYFLYYEDVDICARVHLHGWRVVVAPACRVVHAAQRSSHRSLKYLRWHLQSMLRFLMSDESGQLKRLRQR